MKITKIILVLFFKAILFSVIAISAQIKQDSATGLYYDSQGNPYTGIYKEYNDDGLLLRKLQFLDGQFNGENTVFFADGGIKEIQSYKAGLMDGTWTTYNQSGIKTAEAGYRQGKKHGPWFIWNDEGILMFEMYYDKGDRSGTWVKYAENGEVINSMDY